MKLVKSKYVGKAVKPCGKNSCERSEVIKDSLGYLPSEVVNGDVLLLSEQLADGRAYNILSAGYEVPSFPPEIENLVQSLSGAEEIDIWGSSVASFHFLNGKGQLETDYLGTSDVSNNSFYKNIGCRYGVNSPNEFYGKVMSSVENYVSKSKYSVAEIIISKSEDGKKYIGFTELHHKNKCTSIVHSGLKDNPWNPNKKEYLLTIFY